MLQHGRGVVAELRLALGALQERDAFLLSLIHIWMVAITFASLGAVRLNSTPSGGSSSTFSKALALAPFSLSAPLMCTARPPAESAVLNICLLYTSNHACKGNLG